MASPADVPVFFSVIFVSASMEFLFVFLLWKKKKSIFSFSAIDSDYYDCSQEHNDQNKMYDSEWMNIKCQKIAMSHNLKNDFLFFAYQKERVTLSYKMKREKGREWISIVKLRLLRLNRMQFMLKFVVSTIYFFFVLFPSVMSQTMHM